MKRIIVVVITFLFVSAVFAQAKEKIIYKKRQTIDLGALEIDGEVLAPGPINVTDDKEKATQLLFKRKHYYDRLKINIEYVF